MTEKLRVVLPMPPTSNNIYADKGGGGRVKTTEARSWQIRAVKEIMRQARLGIQDQFDEEKMYWLDLHFFFDQVVNKGWSEFYSRGKKKGQRKAETKWKKIDLGNRLKLLEDTVKNVTGVDDSATFVLHLTKDLDPSNPRVEVRLYEMGDEL